MNILVIYDSVFGNTEKIAQSVAQALEPDNQVRLLRSKDVDVQMLSADLIIAGSPTQKFNPTPEITSLLKQLPVGKLHSIPVAVFDTRISVEDTNSGILRFFVKCFGYAAETLGKRLQKKGGRLRADPEGFIVQDVKGPLKKGELERAAEWARSLVEN